jgi:two-component system, OmpR family, KDP operon response regulator KdpE
MRILVVAAPDKAQGLAFQLGLLGHAVAASADTTALVLRSVEEVRPDVVLLDGVPNDALKTLVRTLRERVNADLIVMPRTYSEDDLVYYLTEGVADYLPRPLTPRGLSARLAALHQRRNGGEQPVIGFGGTQLDPANRAVYHNGAHIPLTPTEYRLLEVLLDKPGRACSHKTLLRAVWGPDFEDCEHYLRVYIRHIRQKLERDPANPRFLVTVRGIGYRLAGSGRSRPFSEQRARRPARAPAPA